MIGDLLAGVLAETILPLALTLVLTAVGWATTKAVDWLKGKTELVKLERIRVALDQLVDAAAIAVKETAQTAVDKLKLAAADGKLTPSEAAAAADAAIDRAWELLAPEIRQILIGLFGTETDAKAAAVAPAIEAAVRDLPRPTAPADPTPAQLDALQRDAHFARRRLGLQP